MNVIPTWNSISFGLVFWPGPVCVANSSIFNLTYTLEHSTAGVSTMRCSEILPEPPWVILVAVAPTRYLVVAN